MNAFLIRNEADHRRAIELIDQLWDAELGSPQHDTLLVMSALVDSYEARNRDLPPADSTEVIRLKLRELGWTQRELGRRLGWGSGRVSEILSAKRPLTLAMVRDLTRVLGLPADLLVHERDAGGSPVWIALDVRLKQPLGQLARALSMDLDALVHGVLTQFIAQNPCSAQVHQLPEPSSVGSDLRACGIAA